jgi:hypothetical protein
MRESHLRESLRVLHTPGKSLQHLHNIVHVFEHDVEEAANDSTDAATDIADETPTNLLDVLSLPLAEVGIVLGTDVKSLPYEVFVTAMASRPCFMEAIWAPLFFVSSQGKEEAWIRSIEANEKEAEYVAPLDM